MQNQENCYKNVWILSGTSDGPVIANRLLELNYSVFASVLTYKAGQAYIENPKLHIITGKLNNKDQIINFINKNKITCVIDATHPFAVIISKNLNNACKEINTPLLLFERKSLINTTNNFFYIDHLKDINNVDIENKNILLAIGSRFLNDTASYYMNCKANVFTRVLPTYESITKAFGSCIKNSNIAILEPSKNNKSILEKKLCDFWEIDYVLCRESGSYSQKNWESIVSGSKMKLFLVKRPKVNNDYSYSFEHYHNLINHIIKKY
ncbi:precorrin-6A/cobalt-precorrin-6A reductase [Prochlorococcus marinus XMU1414]|uniref:Precorrin-6A/cobalt-precorrin-6A reductase n=1 Tax=Prochlorococcus marinus XMU1424 TaxID=2774497 RepID=A0A9D9BYL2_PROMR|nr:precorrin-6A/cobalt-precorrin-6A reductase [Prochlorococcus marinus]MBO8227794.1 precorrin-6A/cobalt-precorrin-6A reductase [Prochlorococcus marinus XMU1414]MBW3045307.1 cobalt-precorrin-6A reductase [Prochlorococcus marinus str. MU1414]MCR8532426.1 precorrin-6A/cobalt-precorrin-6A reductase [Prochlorococcus marinus XMU1420]MCR8535954.1 precorrin-6A/cobalt-precorrin-6A reductase [Prochlorococcus marinus XMU1424]